MNDLKSEELDRELALDHHKNSDGRSLNWSAHKVKITKKMLVFEMGDKRELYFEKRRFLGDGLEMGVAWEQQQTKLCELGHYHPVGKPVPRRERGSIKWEHVEQLVEWLNNGSWTESKGRKSPIYRIMGEALKCIEELESGTDPTVMKGMIAKVKRELKYELGER